MQRNDDDDGNDPTKFSSPPQTQTPLCETSTRRPNLLVCVVSVCASSSRYISPNQIKRIHTYIQTLTLPFAPSVSPFIFTERMGMCVSRSVSHSSTRCSPRLVVGRAKTEPPIFGIRMCTNENERIRIGIVIITHSIRMLSLYVHWHTHTHTPKQKKTTIESKSSKRITHIFSPDIYVLSGHAHYYTFLKHAYTCRSLPHSSVHRSRSQSYTQS